MYAPCRAVSLSPSIAVLLWLAVAPAAGAETAQQTPATTDVPADPAAAPAASAPALREVGSWAAARALEVELSAGSVRIVPGSAGRVRVLAPTDADRDDNVELRTKYGADDGVGRLDVSARDDLVVTIEVPATVTLNVRMSAGELEIGPIAGDKDLRLNAGELVLHATESDRQADARLHVTTGEIQWERLDVRRGGLFRSYLRGSGGRSKLHARVLAGELRIL